MGIDVNRTISLTFLIAGALAGAAGLVVALYYGQTRFELRLPVRPVCVHGGRPGRASAT